MQMFRDFGLEINRNEGMRASKIDSFDVLLGEANYLNGLENCDRDVSHLVSIILSEYGHVHKLDELKKWSNYDGYKLSQFEDENGYQPYANFYDLARVVDMDDYLRRSRR